MEWDLDMGKATEIKPCPKCVHEKIRKYKHDYVYVLECEKCFYDYRQLSEKRLIKFWNLMERK